MGMQKKNYLPIGGIDLKSSDIIRRAPYLSGGRNARYDDNSELVKRFGKKCVAGKESGDYAGANGIYRLKNVNYRGVSKEELICLNNDYGGGGSPSRLVEETLDISNATGGPITVSHYYDETAGEFVFKADDGTEFLNVGLGIGNSSVGANDKSVDALRALIDATAELGAVTLGDYQTLVAASHMELLEDVVIASGRTLAVKYWYWEPLYVATGVGTIQGVDLINGLNSAATNNGVLYFSNVNTASPDTTIPGTLDTSTLLKYDGMNFYRAGLPPIEELLSFAETAGSPTDIIGSFNSTADTTSYDWKANLVFIDQTGQVIEGQVSPEITVAPAAGDTVKLIPLLPGNAKLTDYGFNTKYAVTDFSTVGTPGSLLRVDDGLGGATDIEIGDVVYFYDVNQGKFISREVIGKSGLGLTLSSDPIQPDDAGGNFTHNIESLVTCNMRLALWRRPTGVGEFTLYAEMPFANIPGLSQTGEYVHRSTLARNNQDVGARFIDPPYTPALPPACTVVSTYKNQLVLGGLVDDAHAVAFADVNNLESFPLATHRFNVGEPVTSLKESGGVLSIFGRTSIDVCFGDLGLLNFRVENVAETIGAVNHEATIQIEEGVLGFLSTKGPYILVNGRQIQPMGPWEDQKTTRVEPYFLDRYFQDDPTTGAYIPYPVFQSARATFWEKYKLYILHIPWTQNNNTGVASDQSDTFVYDYGKGAWLPIWTGLTAELGLAEYQNTIWGSGRIVPEIAGSDVNFWKLVADKGIYNYGDHEAVVDTSILSPWESLEEPNVFKKYLRLILGSVGFPDSPTWSMRIRTYFNYDLTALSTDATFTVLNTDKFKRLKLKSGKANSMMIEFYNDSRYQTFLITGWNLDIGTPYKFPKSAFRSEA